MSIDYTLVTYFEDADLERLNETGSRVIISKPSKGSSPNVAWNVYSPWQSNVMTWVEQYGIYASTVSIEHGVVLNQMSRCRFPAQDGVPYELLDSHSFESPPYTDPEDTFVAGSFYAKNLCESPEHKLTFGLFQDAIINGQPAPGNAISAVPVLYGSKAKMTPETTVYVWVESDIESNSVFTEVKSPKTSVQLGGTVNEARLSYNAKTGGFTVEYLGNLAPDVTVEKLLAGAA